MYLKWLVITKHSSAHPLTSVIGFLQWDHLILAPVFKLPQAEARQFNLEPAVHQTRAGLQVPVKSQVTFVDELHSLKTGWRQRLSSNCHVNNYTHCFCLFKD